MNIIHIISSPASGGAEVYVKDLAKQLSSRGHSLHIAFLSSAHDAGRDTKYEEYFLNDLKSSGVQTYIIGNETRRKPWLGIIRLKKYIKKNDIEICHTHLAYGIIFSAFLDIPVIYTHHTIQPRWGKVTYTVFNRIVNKYVGISRKCALALTKYTGREVTTIFNAVSEDKFKSLVRQRKLENIVNISMVGRLVIEKDYFNILEALTLLDANTLRKVKLRIAGEGNSEYKKEILSFIDQRGLNKNVELLGVVTNIPKFLYESDIFVISSSSEGLPIALLEATISGLPCIVTDVGGCSEVIETAKNGVVVPPGNPQIISETLNSLIQYPKMLHTYSKNALTNSHLYSISKAADLHIQLYSEVLNN